MLQHEKKAIYVFLYVGWCLCWCERESTALLSAIELSKNGAGCLCASFSTHEFSACEHDWPASLISFTFSGREKSAGRKVSDEKPFYVCW